MKRFIWITIILLILPVMAGAAEYKTGVKAQVILQTETMSNGQPIKYMDLDNPLVTVMIIEIAPGAETGWHSHPIPVYAYVLEGQIRAKIEGGKEADFKKGEAFVEVVNVLHNGVNVWDVPVKMVVFYLGAKDMPNVVKAKK